MQTSKKPIFAIITPLVFQVKWLMKLERHIPEAVCTVKTFSHDCAFFIDSQLIIG